MHCTLFGEDNGKQARQFSLRLEYSRVMRAAERVSTSLMWWFVVGALLLQRSSSARTEFIQFLSSFFTRFDFCVPYSSSVHRALGEKATVPIYKVLGRPGRDSNSRPTFTPSWRTPSMSSRRLKYINIKSIKFHP